MAEEYTAEEILQIQSEVARLQKEGKAIPESLAKSYADIAKGVKNYSATIEKSFKNLGSALVNTAIDSKRGAKKYGSILDAGAKIGGAYSSKSKIWGKTIEQGMNMLAGFGKAALEASDTLFESYQDLTSVGALGQEGMTGLLDNLHKFSFSLDEMGAYGDMVKSNSDILARIGGTTNKGLKEMGAMSEELLEGGTNTSFYEMGMDTQAVNDGLMAYNRYQVMLGHTTKQNYADRMKGTREWIRVQRDLTKITGLNTKALEQISFSAANESRWGSYLSELKKRDPEAVEKLNAVSQKFTALYGESTARGFRDIAQGIIGNSEEAAKFQRSFPETAELILNGVKDEKSVTDAIQRDARRMSPMVNRLSLYQSEAAGLYEDINTYNKILADRSYDERQAMLKTEKTIIDKGTAAASGIAAANRKLALTKDNVVTAGIAPALKAFNILNDLLIKILPGAKAQKPPGEDKGGAGAGGAPGTPSGPNPISEILSTGPGYAVVKRPDGKTEKLEGARNWRNNNPGNIEYGSFAKSHGAIGSDGRFAIFPDYDTGRKAKAALIFDGKNYAGLSLTAAINRYAPPSENNTSAYQQSVLAAVDNQNKLMSQYSDSERERIMDAMQKVEGFKVGKVTTVSAATGGIVSGPSSGYEATLHGTEAVIPLGNGDSIKVSGSNHVEMISVNNSKLNQQLGKLADLSRALKDQVSVSDKILRYTH